MTQIYELTIDGEPTGRLARLVDVPDFTGHPTKSSLRWLPVAKDYATARAGEAVQGFTTKAVEGDRVVYRRGVRAVDASKDVLDEGEARVAALEAGRT